MFSNEHRVGDTIKRVRATLGLTQVELAARSRVSLPTLQIVEANTGNPSLETLNVLFKALGLGLNYEVIPADWDFLAACGVPIRMEERSKIHPSRELLIRELERAMVELSHAENSTDSIRKREATHALILALSLHYSSVFQNIKRSSFVQNLLMSEASGRVIKLKRIALSRLATYL